MDHLTRLLLGIATLIAGLCATVLVLRFPLPAFLIGAALVGRKLRRAVKGSDVYGTARWCTEDEARRGGLL